nr:nucleotidyltransferase family protein [Rubellimicrobium roseum]
MLWPSQIKADLVVRRALYHGIAGCLASRLGNWPTEAADPLRRAAMAQAMWEMRHQIVLSSLLQAMAAAGIRVLVLKGSALAYDLYDSPAARSRGDSDILIEPKDLPAARAVLSDQGFSHFYDDPTADENVRLQEAWTHRTADGLMHEVDLHWQTLNAPALADLFPFTEIWTRARALPRLAPVAYGLARDSALLFACAHRAQHIVNPYFVDGSIYYGGDRLIWLYDIDLLSRALDETEWAAFEVAVRQSDLAEVALHGLQMAADRLGTPLPCDVISRLERMNLKTKSSRYLLSSRQTGRAWRDLRAIQGSKAKAAFLAGRAFPSEAFIRAKYPDMADRPLLLLHLRRILNFVKPRPRGVGQ